MKVKRSAVRKPISDKRPTAISKPSEKIETAEESFESAAESGNDKSLWGTSAQVSEASDEIFEGIVSETVPAEGRTEVISVLSDEEDDPLSVGADEDAYKATELKREAAPIIQDTVHTEVKRAVKLNNDRLKVEVNEVLQDEVGYRLDQYERRRRFRQRKDLVFSAVKGVLILGVVLFIMGNAQLRTRFMIIGKDFAELFGGLIHDEEVSSNKLVEDMFRDLGDDLNDANTVVYEESAE